MIQVKSKEEAIEWVKRCPNPMPGESEIEIRQVFEAEDFGAALTPELREQEERLARQPARESSVASVRWRRLARAARDVLSAVTATDTHRAIDAVWRIESAKLIAGLTRIVRDVGLAEELAQDALVAALEQWPESGVPGQPGRLAHGHREAPRHRSAAPRAGCSSASTRSSGDELEAAQERAAPDLDAALDDDVGDDLLRLVFIVLPPGALDRGARRAHAAPARRPHDRRDRARLPRARADDRAAHRAREADARRGARCRSRCRAAPSSTARLSSVLEVIYLDVQRGLLGDRRRRLDAAGAVRGRAATGPHPRRAGAGRGGGARARRADGDPGVARARARGPSGRADPAARAEPRALGSAAHPSRPRRARAGRDARRRAGPYALQAAIAACHARARTAEETDWARIAALYDALAELMPSPVVELNRAVARGDGVRSGGGPRAGRCADGEPSLESYHLLPSVRGDLLVKLGRTDEARAEFERAASLTRNARERELLLDRADETPWGQSRVRNYLNRL